MKKEFIPNLFTFANLSFGMISIMFTFNNNLRLAALMIILAALLDRYDGRIARKIGVSSELGKELDSLADLVSFGAAPAILSWQSFLINFGIIGYIITLLFPIAGAFRLARFNVTQFNNVFTGVPITVAGSVVALDNIIGLYKPHPIISTIIFIVFAYLMVSKIKIKKF
ncbi:CDP-diacylglycerol--serine O-phosphatidyltransferase [Thermobrachium celere]|uniref:CDP-diacylglycerol--serine O-phosphatidyltransferase n=1 Tax=Thermobrachium celere DSM 8682 TaxID=941824 RepID=R7RQM0_9CLOT|nr:CDP-diacylglycerol--serine O-phosphatidyltransferase [Thermobrachium celere]GFR35405.1 CDP-diacylglycerol--serine O-phosphatidyltransferase [Thermobrachium celere]CDF57573.1 CDP-diacylglycerol--serine O-phosphatidyltransferase [Thermobrachium celere DSM 8682]